MKTRFIFRCGMGALVVLAVLAVGGMFWLHPGSSDQQAVAAVRQQLRLQGFKTDLSEFNFTTDADLRARENALFAADPGGMGSNPFQDLNLRKPVGDDAALVFWQQPAPLTENDEELWPALQVELENLRQQLNDACEAALSGPIQFNLAAGDGQSMLLPHLALMKRLTLAFDSRMVYELHAGHATAAWTNLLAATRLATAWRVEPVEVSHMVHFSLIQQAGTVTWELLQTNVWTEAQLAELQAEWEALDLFTNLPATLAFKRACIADLCRRDRLEPSGMGFSGGDFFKALWESPRRAWAELNAYWNQIRYRNHGTYVDETKLLLFFRDREVEMQRALAATNWLQMRTLPGVTNHVSYQSKYRSRLAAMMDLQIMQMRILRQGSSFLGAAAEAEARRRLIITALALERYHVRHGEYPPTLAALVPAFLKSAPTDFMDGQPLRYRLTDDGHFILYSVGLDGVDNGGKLPSPAVGDWPPSRRLGMAGGTAAETNLVWPRPATPAQMAAAAQAEAAAAVRQLSVREEQIARYQWQQTSRHQADVALLLGAPVITNVPDPDLNGRPLSEQLANPVTVGTNRLSLCQMLTLRQIITGAEPETVTFELPLAYTAVTNLGSLCLVVDTNNDDSDSGSLAQQLECCANETNGNTLLVWSTLYESPGLHAVQAWFNFNDSFRPTVDCAGPWLSYMVTNLCQFSLGSATYDEVGGAIFHARLPETNGRYTIECLTTNGEHLKTLTGSTTNGEFKAVWDLVDDHGHRLTGETFNSTVQITLPDSGSTQTLRGP